MTLGRQKLPVGATYYGCKVNGGMRYEWDNNGTKLSAYKKTTLATYRTTLNANATLDEELKALALKGGKIYEWDNMKKINIDVTSEYIDVDKNEAISFNNSDVVCQNTPSSDVIDNETYEYYERMDAAIKTLFPELEHRFFSTPLKPKGNNETSDKQNDDSNNFYDY